MKRPTIWAGTSLLLTGAVFLARPGVLGEYLGLVYLAVAVLLILAGLSVGRWQGFSSRDAVVVFCAYGIYWGYRIFQILLSGHQEAMLDVGKSIVIEGITLALIFTYLAEETRRNQFYLFFSCALALLGFSSMTSEVISWLGHSAAISLYTFKRTTSELSIDLVLQFPFSISYGEYHGLSARTLYRYTGGFIEAGIYPAFGCWAIAYSMLTPGKKWWIILGCSLGIIATFSTAAVLCVAVMVPALLFTLFARTRRFHLTLKIPVLGLMILLVPVAAAAVYFAPDIGLADKAETHGTSLEDRSFNIHRAITTLPSNFLGHYTREENNSICLLAAAYSLGSVGLLLWLFKFGSSVWSRDNDLLKVAACISPLLLTLTVSQPLFDAMPAVILLLFTRFQGNEFS